ncbi:MAG: hypothetical protein J6A01_06645 [Proteobacteria bacterium]|nr:hypothetical protein [Pseudomonadota bacterium]
MKKQFVFFMIIFFALLGITTNAYADIVCPPGSQKIVDDQTREVFCIAAPGAAQTNQQPINTYHAQAPQKDYRNQYDQELELDEIHDSIADSGFELQFGLGYGVIAAVGLQVKLEYSFAQMTDGMSLGLFTNVALLMPYPNTLNWSAGPILHINGNRFRGGFGLGFGLFNIWDDNLFGESDGYYDDYGYYHDYEKKNHVYFSLIPRVECEWFVSKHLYLGFGLDFPLIFYHNDNKDKVSTAAGLWFDVLLHVGYKF